MTRATKDKWLAEGLQVLAASGAETISVELLSARLGVSKASFHWHFGDREAFLRELVVYWGERALDGDGARVFAGDPGADRAMRAWAVRDPEVRARVQAVDAGRMAQLTEIHRRRGAAEPERMARLEYAVFVGASWLLDDLDGREGRALADDLARLLGFRLESRLGSGSGSHANDAEDRK